MSEIAMLQQPEVEHAVVAVQCVTCRFAIPSGTEFGCALE